VLCPLVLNHPHRIWVVGQFDVRQALACRNARQTKVYRTLSAKLTHYQNLSLLY
jgi:hypothetical protein